MVRSRKKSSTDNDTGDVVATPSRRSGRARKTVSYGEEDEIPVALCEFFQNIYIQNLKSTSKSF